MIHFNYNQLMVHIIILKDSSCNVKQNIDITAQDTTDDV